MATYAGDVSLVADRQPAGIARSAPAQERYLFGPVIDFLCLGGMTLLLLPVVLAIGDTDNFAGVSAIMLIVAHFINHPHFAASYQIFYRDFRKNALTPALGRPMQRRYQFAGILVPGALVALFIYGIAATDAQLLGYAANLMALAVGWHYTKQGYGMLMVDAVLKRRFVGDTVKKVLLVNCYVAWLASWMGFNAMASQQDLWGLAYYSFAIPQPLIHAAYVGAAITGVGAVIALAEHRYRVGPLPMNGVIAYFVSIYAWLMFVTINPIWALVVPALHSLQYLVVVGRFELNRAAADQGEPLPRWRRIFGNSTWPAVVAFFAVAGVMGWLGFWGIPGVLDGLVPYDNLALTPTMFLFASWIFINVHHYFMDNVMWRRENPDTRKYLFN